MHTDFTMHGARKITTTLRVRETYTVTYITVTDTDGNTHTLKAFHAEDLLAASILEEQADE